MMRKSPLLLILATLLLLVGCEGCSNKKADSDKPVTDSLAMVQEPVFKEVSGTIGDGTSMNVIEVVTEEGDTIYITNQAQMVTGGLVAGERIDIVYADTGDELVGHVAINVSALTHLWSQLDGYGNEQSLELAPNGEAYTRNMPTVNYDSWSLEGGLLLLHSPAVLTKEIAEHTDTFQIMRLTETQLVLSTHGVEMEYER